MSESLIETRQLTKSYGSVRAVDALDWRVASGSISALVGPNGAGKTTILKMLLGMTRPTAGSATVLGHDVVTESVAIRRRIAMVPEDKLLYDNMVVASFLKFVRSFYPTWDATMAEELLDRWEIPRRQEIKALSKGMRAKLALAAAVSRQPQVLILDEPTIDLDPAGVEEILSWISGWVADEGRGAVLATHRLEEVDRICDTITFLRAGRSILSGDLDDLRSEWRSLIVYGKVPHDELKTWPGVRDMYTRGEVSTVVVVENADGVYGRLVQMGIGAVEAHPMSLREIYLTATGFRRRLPDDVLEGMD